MITIGIDPGMRHCGVARLDNDILTHSHTLDTPSRFRGAEGVLYMGQALGSLLCRIGAHEAGLFVIEGQAWFKKAARPNDLIWVAQVAGVAIAFGMDAGARVLVPLPVVWKGSVPKHIHNKRVITRAFGANMWPMWKGRPDHEIDALGLCMWGAKLKKLSGCQLRR